MSIRKIAEFVWKRHQSQWNWIIMLSVVWVFFMALWFHSVLLIFVCIAGLVASLCELPDPVPPFEYLEKVIEHERKWLASRSSWKKKLQGLGILSGIVYVCASCWAGSLMALLLFVGICVNIVCVYGNKAMGVDDL